jgi:hypothetical protein
MLQLRTDSLDSEARIIELRVRGLARPMIQVVPSQLQLGNVKSNSTVERNLVITSTTNDLPSRIISCWSDSSFVTIEQSSSQQNQITYKVCISNVPAGFFASAIHIKLALSKKPEIIVCVAGNGVSGDIGFFPSEGVNIDNCLESPTRSQRVIIRSATGKAFRIGSIRSPNCIKATIEDLDVSSASHVLNCSVVDASDSSAILNGIIVELLNVDERKVVIPIVYRTLNADRELQKYQVYLSCHNRIWPTNTKEREILTGVSF